MIKKQLFTRLLNYFRSPIHKTLFPFTGFVLCLFAVFLLWSPFLSGCILLLISAVVLMLVLIPDVAHAYTVRFGPSGPCHEIITGKAIDLLEKEAKIRNFPHWEEIRVYRQKLMEGARHEDYYLEKLPGEPVQEDERVKLFHYYNPLLKRAFSDEAAQKYKKMGDSADLPAIKSTAIQRALNHETKLMQAYESGDFERVYWCLGRICHLLQDMTVPAHVHGDIHWENMEDDFEKQVDYYARSGRMLNYSIANQYFMKIYHNFQRKGYKYFSDLLGDYMHNTALHTFIRSTFKIDFSVLDQTGKTHLEEGASFRIGKITKNGKDRYYLEDKNGKQLFEDADAWNRCTEKPGYIYIRQVHEVVPFYWREINKNNVSLWELYYKYFIGWAINSTAALLMLWYEMIPRLETGLEDGTTADAEDPVSYSSFRIRNLGGIREKIIIELEDIPSYITPVLRQKNRPLKRDLHNPTKFELDLESGEDAKIDLEFSGKSEIN